MDEIHRDQLLAEIAGVREETLERIRAQLSLAEIGFRSIILVNGGGIIGLLTFMGNGGAAKTGLVVGGFACLLIGMALALAALVLSFLSQRDFYEQSVAEQRRVQRSLLIGEGLQVSKEELTTNRSGTAHFNAALLLVIGSIAAFALGSGLALAGVMGG